MKIITTTLNPAFDMHYKMNGFTLYKENYVDSILIAAGGKGINISRTLAKNNIDNTAFVILGRENAEYFISRLNEDGLRFKAIYCEGRIRENITIHTPGNPETRISLDSFSISEEALEQLLRELLLIADDKTILTFSGRIPKGIPPESAANFLLALRRKGCMLVIDCNSFTLEELIRIRAWLVKPNEQEVEALLGEKIASMEQAVKAARQIHKSGIENVIVSMGRAGAAAAAGGMAYILQVPHNEPLSTVGAGDSMIAGFIAAFAKGECIEECLRDAAAFGSAAVLTEGTSPPVPSEIERIRPQVKVVRV